MRARLRFPAAGCLGVAWASLLLLSVVQRGDGEARARYIEVYEPFPFTPDGSRLQLQHAQQAAKKVSVFALEYATPVALLGLMCACRLQGSLSLGIVARDGVVLAAESRLPSPLVVGSSKMGRIDKHLAYVMSGISADGRYLVKRARVLAQVREEARNLRCAEDSACNPWLCPVGVMRVHRGTGSTMGSRWGCRPYCSSWPRS